VFPSKNIVIHQATKKGNDDGSMESKSKYRIMESYQISQKGSDQYQTRENRHAGKKKENTLDIVSKSVNQNIVNQMFNLNFFNHGNY
tara:strand:- start:44 stop:304 length:261 start_codon:yes stop_codon:yes gene_type:complete